MSQKLFIRTLITGVAASALLAGGQVAKAAEETSAEDNQLNNQETSQNQSNQVDGMQADEVTTDTVDNQDESETSEQPSNESVTMDQPPVTTDEAANPEQPTEQPTNAEPAQPKLSPEELKQQEIEKAQTNLNQATAEVNEAQVVRDKAFAEKTNADKALTDAKAIGTKSTKQVDKQIADETKKLNNTKSKASTAQIQLDKKQAEITQKEQQLKNYKPEVKEAVTHTSDVPTDHEKIHTHKWAEDVKYSGTPQIVKLPANKDQYVPNSERVGQIFVDYLNELKRINGLPGRVTLSKDPAVQAFSKARADESAANYRAHYTELPGKDQYQGAENLARSFTFTENPYSDEELAYYMLLSWFSDYNNAEYGYGHRSNLLGIDGDIGFATVEYGDGEYLYQFLAVMNVQTWDKEIYNKITETKVGDTLEYRIDGKEIYFVPKKTFKYVTTETIDKSGAIKNELAKLNKEKANLESQIKSYNDEIAKTENLITNLKEQRALINADQAKKQKAIADAKVLVEKNNKALAQAEKDLAEAMKNKTDAQKALDKLLGKEETKPTNTNKPTNNKPVDTTKPTVKPVNEKPVVTGTSNHKPGYMATNTSSTNVNVTLPTGEKVTMPKYTVGKTGLNVKQMSTGNVVTNDMETNAVAQPTSTTNNMAMLPNTGQEQRNSMLAGLMALLAGVATFFGFRRKSSQK